MVEAADPVVIDAYIGDELNRWPAAHVLDVARLYRLAIERAERAGAQIIHALATVRSAIDAEINRQL